MRHKRRRGRLGLVFEHRQALLRNLAKALIINQRIVTTHIRAKEASKFVDQLVTVAKRRTLHSRRLLVSKLGSGSEQLVKRLIDLITPAFEKRQGGYTRVLRYRNRAGDGAQLSLLEFTVPIETEKKKVKKKEKKHPEKDIAKKDEPAHLEKQKTEEKTKENESKKGKDAGKKESSPKGGFLGTLRKFLKGE